MNPLKKMTLQINGVDRTFVCDPAEDTLAAVLRRLGLTGTKIGCGLGVCGACSVLMDGTAIHSCTRRISSVKEGAVIVTVEGIGTPDHPHPLQTAFVKNKAILCGFCTPGFVVSAYALLEKNPAPSREDVRDWFGRHRNLCRCTGYKPIVDAVMEAAGILRGEAPCESISEKPSEALAKACGVYDYSEDIALEMPKETLHVALVQPKAAHHAHILKINKEDAERSEGVYKIILLGKEDILHFGDVIALVCADTRTNARAAASKVTMAADDLPGVLPEVLPAAPPQTFLSIEGGSAQAYLTEDGEITVSGTAGAGADQLAEFARMACQACDGRPVALSATYAEYLALVDIPQNNPLAAGIPTIANVPDDDSVKNN
jgi:aldehyde oxidoreductase